MNDLVQSRRAARALEAEPRASKSNRKGAAPRRQADTLAKAPPQPGRGVATVRTNYPEATRRNILAVATAEFADKGFSGTRVDEIAALTNTSKRMIYFYFEGKEGLFVAFHEDAC